MLTEAQQRKNAKKWIKALRSGKYKQGKQTLKRNDEFCCLGVACEIFKDELDLHIEEAKTDRGDVIIYYNNKAGSLPNEVRKHIGLRYSAGATDNLSLRHLSSMNDSGKTFDEIADHLEANWTDYFVHSKK